MQDIGIILSICALIWAIIFIAFDNKELKLINGIAFALMLGFIAFALNADNNLCSTVSTPNINGTTTLAYNYCPDKSVSGLLTVFVLLMFIFGAIGARIGYKSFRKG